MTANSRYVYSLNSTLVNILLYLVIGHLQHEALTKIKRKARVLFYMLLVT